MTLNEDLALPLHIEKDRRSGKLFGTFDQMDERSNAIATKGVIKKKILLQERKGTDLSCPEKNEAHEAKEKDRDYMCRRNA